jgi:hypothetical protein
MCPLTVLMKFNMSGGITCLCFSYGKYILINSDGKKSTYCLFSTGGEIRNKILIQLVVNIFFKIHVKVFHYPVLYSAAGVVYVAHITYLLAYVKSFQFSLL